MYHVLLSDILLVFIRKIQNIIFALIEDYSNYYLYLLEQNTATTTTKSQLRNKLK